MTGDIVRAKRFEVVDDNDRVRAVLGSVDEDDPVGLMIMDENEQPSIEVTFSTGRGAALTFRNTEEDQIGLQLRLDSDDGSPYLLLSGTKSRGDVSMGVANDGRPIIAIEAVDPETKEETNTILVSASNDGPTAITLLDKQRRVRAALHLRQEGGKPTLRFLDEEGRVTTGF